MHAADLLAYPKFSLLSKHSDKRIDWKHSDSFIDRLRNQKGNHSWNLKTRGRRYDFIIFIDYMHVMHKEVIV